MLFLAVLCSSAAEQPNMQEIDRLLKSRSCPLAALQHAIVGDASYIGENGDTYLIASGRSQQDCPTIVQYLLDNGAIDSYRLLNHTFWRNTTAEELTELLPAADLYTTVTAYADQQKPDNFYAVDYAIESTRPELLAHQIT
ncbi:MAG: hypothetical protein LBV04_07670 [Deferribacteraceae bacterium]|nr:hypothetical protein [Deferribacteraceae bacterium]